MRLRSPLLALLSILSLGACQRGESAAGQRQDAMKAECAYVGEWKATRVDADYTVSMTDDGKFRAWPNDGRGSEMSGKWGVAGGKMIWIYDDMPGKRPEANAIETVTPDVFDLVEADRSKTHYVRMTPDACVR